MSYIKHISKELVADRDFSHKMTKTPEYKAWQNMKARCNNPNRYNYNHYGGRGIEVCEKWAKSFVDFYNDMGPKPSGKHSLDRIDADGNYEPKNCRWATYSEQGLNRRVVNNTGVKGISIRNGRYRVRLGVGGKIISVGTFGSLLEASQARDLAEVKQS